MFALQAALLHLILYERRPRRDACRAC